MHTYTTDQKEGMLAETVSTTGHNGESIDAYFARPAGDGPFPGVVLIHHAPGWDEWYKEATRRFAHHGYAAICPNLYQRAGHGTPEDVGAKIRGAGGVSDEQVIGDVVGSMQYLRAQSQLNGKVGLIGSCSGGRHTVLVVSKADGFDAAVDCWGGRVVQQPDELTPNQPVAVIDMTKDLRTPLLGLFGNDDQFPTPAQVDQHEAELKKHSKKYEFHRYDGAGHGFFYYDRPAYRQEQAVDGWQKIWAFFGKHLGGEA